MREEECLKVKFMKLKEKECSIGDCDTRRRIGWYITRFETNGDCDSEIRYNYPIERGANLIATLFSSKCRFIFERGSSDVARTKVIAFAGYRSKTAFHHRTDSASSRSAETYYPFAIISSDNKSILLSGYRRSPNCERIRERQRFCHHWRHRTPPPPSSPFTTCPNVYTSVALRAIHFQHPFFATRTQRLPPLRQGTRRNART